jgi:hypothetical protein
MTLDITLEPDTEEIVIILDNHTVLKANKGVTVKDLKLCKNFRTLEEEDDKLFRLLRGLAANLFTLE